ncbi:conserved domain protein [delta proteobacterium NaphS2]|nr:conserved domain protein [delta proteobacterium NaphS2]
MAICIFKWTESHLIYTKSEEIPSENDFFNQIIYSTGNRRMSQDFLGVSDYREGNPEISMADALMSGFAVFSLKDPSLLAFDKRRQAAENLESIYHVESIPCDSQMRTILDEVDPVEIRPAYKNIFSKLQRGKALERLAFFQGCYLLSLDGTGYFSSKKIFSDNCLQKVNKKTGEITYYQQMLGAAIVHPDLKEVIPLAPEFIIKQDGQSKNDCERNAAKRFFDSLRKDHPHLPVIITEDALSSNAPHIREAENTIFITFWV